MNPLLVRIIIAILVLIIGPWLLGYFLPAGIAWVISVVIAIALIVTTL
jgi:hypothetical protein